MQLNLQLKHHCKLAFLSTHRVNLQDYNVAPLTIVASEVYWSFGEGYICN